jgi:hypothetical protein
MGLDLSACFREKACLDFSEGIGLVHSLQERLDAAFPATADAQLVHSVQQGILLADGVVENEPWLRGPMAGDVRGYLRRAGIISRVYSACVSGDLPFTASLAKMPRGPFHWVEVGSNDFTAHICRTEGPSAFPEDTPTRQDERLTNQFDLFPAPTPTEAGPVKQFFAWLSFGAPSAGSLTHLCWAMPAADGKSWLARTNILRRLEVADIRIEAEPPTERAVLRFKDEIASVIGVEEAVLRGGSTRD